MLSNRSVPPCTIIPVLHVSANTMPRTSPAIAGPLPNPSPT